MPEGVWNHNLCERDWFLSEKGVLEDGAFRVPVRVKESSDVCCACGTPTVSGIYIRADPTSMLCQGAHETPDQWSPIIGGKLDG